MAISLIFPQTPLAKNIFTEFILYIKYKEENMNISPISNKGKCTFQGYKITPDGVTALKKLTNIEEKQAIIECCNYFKNKKYVHVSVSTDNSGDLALSLSIPDCKYWIRNFRTPYHTTSYNDRGIYITADLTPAHSKNVFVNLNGKQGDGSGSNSTCKMNQLSNQFDHTNYTIFQKIAAFKTLGDKVEEARMSIEKSKLLNPEVDNLFTNQNL